MTPSAVHASLADQDHPGSGERTRPGAYRYLPLAGVRAAGAAAVAGIAMMTILVVAGWIAAPHPRGGLIGVLRTAAVLWLVGHHVAVRVAGAGRIGMLPLGLVLMPGAALWWAGRSLARGYQMTRPRQVVSAAAVIAVPYTAIAGVLAVVSRTSLARASVPQAVLAGFAIAFVASWFGAARATAPWGKLGELMSAPSRSILAGSAGSLATLGAAGFLTTAVAIANHEQQFTAMYRELDPALAGAGLLLLAQVGYLPNAVIWAISYMLGPGFAVGSGTIVSPTGSVLGRVPAFPLLTALPAAPHASDPGWLAAVMLGMPYLAGAIGGLLVERLAPRAPTDVAAIRGFFGGAGCGLVLGLLAAFAGGPLGDGRLSAVGPSPWQVTLVGVLELGIAAAISAGAAAWWHRRAAARYLPKVPSVPPPGESPPVQPGSRPGRDHDEHGHMIYIDRWAADAADEQSPPGRPKRPRGPSALP